MRPRPDKAPQKSYPYQVGTSQLKVPQRRERNGWLVKSNRVCVFQHASSMFMTLAALNVVRLVVNRVIIRSTGLQRNTFFVTSTFVLDF